MEKPDRKIGKLIVVFAGICVIALPLLVFLAFSYEPKEVKAAVVDPGNSRFDHNGETVFEDHDRISKDYLEGTSTERTLDEYYARRQYIGSPPYIPHKVEDEDGTKPDCLTCHAKGGWTEELLRNTPLTPHPEQTYCRQCHAEITTETLFVQNIWMSVQPPRLGRSHLPGGPPPIPHDLQMRGNCIACHVGPGAVTSIRVDHPSRGNCRQCHVPDLLTGFFQRKSNY
jgi:cytochrome c-type protein NapB